MNTNHTPGPWVADDGDGQYSGVFAAVDGGAIAYLVEPHTERILPVRHSTTIGDVPDMAQHYANAQLIAAAPDLLALVKDIEAYYRPQQFLSDRAEAFSRRARTILTKLGAL